MYLPLSFKKHEQNIWLNCTLDWKLDCNHDGFFCPGFNIAVCVCYFICPTMARPFFLTFVSNLSESFRILTRSYRFRFLKPSEIIWTLRGWKNIFSIIIQILTFRQPPSFNIPPFCSFWTSRSEFEFNLPLLLLVFRHDSLGKNLESQSKYHRF